MRQVITINDVVCQSEGEASDKDQATRSFTSLHGYKRDAPAYKTVINNFTVVKGRGTNSSPPSLFPPLFRVIAFLSVHLAPPSQILPPGLSPTYPLELPPKLKSREDIYQVVVGFTSTIFFFSILREIREN